jgi:ribosomal-protein-alanine N-acetyltransferase
MKPRVLHTERLVVRRWTDENREVFAGIKADAEVMRYRLGTLTRQESDDLIEDIEACFDQYGFGMWAPAVALKAVGAVA